MMARLMLLNPAKAYQEGTFKSYFAIIQLLLGLYVTNDTIAQLTADVCNLRQGAVDPAEYVREL